MIDRMLKKIKCFFNSTSLLLGKIDITKDLSLIEDVRIIIILKKGLTNS